MVVGRDFTLACDNSLLALHASVLSVHKELIDFVALIYGRIFISFLFRMVLGNFTMDHVARLRL